MKLRMMGDILLIVTMTSLSAPSFAQGDITKTGMGLIETIIDAKTYPCFDVYRGLGRQNEFVIDSDSAYSQLKERLGKRCDFPRIDFNRHTLLGLYGGGNNYCSVEYRRHVENDRANKRYIFTLTVIEKGFCKREVRWHWHWVLVPRLPALYNVDFKVHRVRDKNSGERTTSTSGVRYDNVCAGMTAAVHTPGRSGIYGRTISGPTRPVNKDGDTTDAYAPMQATVIVRRLTDNVQISRYTSDIKGEFEISLPPGKYVIEALPVNGKRWPRPQSPCVVTVRDNEHIEVKIRYDTGIR